MAASGSVVRVHRRQKKSAPPNLHLKPQSGARQTFSTSKRQREYMQQLQIDGLYCVVTVQKGPTPPENPIAKTISPPSPEGSESECSEFSESSSASDEPDSDEAEQEKPKKKKEKKKKMTPKSTTKKVVNERPTSVFVCMRNTITSFGRSSENNGLALPDPFVSQKHFQISEEGGTFYVSDQASMNGTFLRKQCDFTREGRVLSANMVFVIGQTAFTVATLRDKSSGTDEKESSNGDYNLTLRFKHKTAYIENKEKQPEVRFRHITLSVPITSKGCLIGRGEDCGIRLVDDAVDDHQAEIFFRDGKFYIRNYHPDTPHGFWTRLSLSAQQSPPFALNDGDVIKVGASELLVEIRTRPPQPKILFPKKAPTCSLDIGTAVDGNWVNQKEMQDRLIVIDGYGGISTNGFFAIFDGHQERRVADFAAAALHHNLLEEIEAAKQNKNYVTKGRPCSPVTFISSTPPASPVSPVKPSPSRFGQTDPDFMFIDHSLTPPPESLSAPCSPFLGTPHEEKKKISDSAPFPLPRRRIVPRFPSAQEALYSQPDEGEYESLRLSPNSSAMTSTSVELDTSSQREPKLDSSEDDSQKGSSVSVAQDDEFRSLGSPFYPGTRSKTISSTVSSIASTVSTVSTGSTSSSESVQGNEGGISIPDCIRNAFDKTAKQLEGMGDISKYGGSTALVCVLWKDEKTNQTKLYTANLGDTRAVLCRNGGPIALSYDHVARDPSEQARVKARGGVIQNNMLGFCLEVSRALGDFGLVPLGMSHDPTISEAILTPKDEFLVLASDGLWNVMSNHAVVDFVKKLFSDKSKPISCDDVARTLLNKALRKPECDDNLSCVVVRLNTEERTKPPPIPEPPEPVPKLTITVPRKTPLVEPDCLVPLPPPSPSLSPLPIQSIQLSPPSPSHQTDPSPVSSKKADSSRRRVRPKTSPPTLELNLSSSQDIRVSQSTSALAAAVVDSEIETDLEADEGGDSPPTPHATSTPGSEHWGLGIQDPSSGSPQYSTTNHSPPKFSRIETAKVASPCYSESPSLDSIFSPPSPSDSTPISVSGAQSSTSSASS